MSQAKKMLKLLGGPPKLVDSDKDGVPDVTDCRPHNKNKQGWVHDKWKQYKKASAERKEYEREVREEAKTTSRVERKKQAIETATYREKIRGERAMKSAKEGGVMGHFVRGITRPAPVRKVAVTAKPRYKYVKKGKKYVRKRVTTKARVQTQAAPPKPKSLSEHMAQYKF